MPPFYSKLPLQPAYLTSRPCCNSISTRTRRISWNLNVMLLCWLNGPTARDLLQCWGKAPKFLPRAQGDACCAHCLLLQVLLLLPFLRLPALRPRSPCSQFLDKWQSFVCISAPGKFLPPSFPLILLILQDTSSEMLFLTLRPNLSFQLLFSATTLYFPSQPPPFQIIYLGADIYVFLFTVYSRPSTMPSIWQMLNK